MGLANIRGMTGLRHLVIRKSAVNKGDIEKLATVLPKCKIEWDGGTIGPNEPERKAAERLNPHVDLTIKLTSGVELVVKQGQALPTEDFVITTILFSGNQIFPLTFTDEVFFPAISELKALSHIYGWMKLNLTEAHVGRLSKLPSVNTLQTIGAVFQLTPQSLDALKQLTNLGSLHCLASNVDDALLERLVTDLPNLWLLGLVEVGKLGKVTERGMAKLASLSRLIVLDLQNPTAVDPSFIRLLTAISTLRTVKISGGQIGDSEVKELVQCQGLYTISLHFTLVTDTSLELLAKMQNLRNLGITKTKVTEAGVKKLAAARPDMRIESDHGTFEPSKK
jgi:hypothetical protein